MYNSREDAPKTEDFYQPQTQESSDIRTVFLSGLPEDVKEREIHNLFRLVPGYEGCKVTLMNQRPVSFASFVSRDAASNAIQQLNGIKFDPDFEYNLKIEFARSNSKMKRLINDANSNQMEKRRKVTTSLYSQPLLPSNGYNDFNNLNTGFNFGAYEQYGAYPDMYGGNGLQSQNPNIVPTHHNIQQSPTTMSYPRTDSRIAPCTTLFVTGIDPNMSNTELAAFFSTGPGFSRFRGGKGNCFLDYVDLNSSAIALHTLNNCQLGETKLRVFYAKKKMGEVKTTNQIVQQ